MKYRIFQNIFFLLKGIRTEHPRLLVLLAVEAVLSVISPVFSIYIPKIALDLTLQGADSERIFMILGTVGFAMALSMALAGMACEGKYMLYNDMRRYYQMQLFFQDIYIPPFTVAENVSMQKADQTDRSRVRDCLIRAGLWEKVSMCEKGMDTPMTKEITDGMVLSGGQQQKLLLARALYKNASILLLDEPTAALDPIAESQVYQQFYETAADKTALYISHRMASTRFCDKIYFLKNGTITEEGTHEELMEKGSDYSEMFVLQSQYYKNGEGEKRYAGE